MIYTAYNVTNDTQTVNLVLDTIRLAIKKEKIAAELQLHSDQGAQYASQAYYELTKEYGIIPSMSSKGNPYDNAMAGKLLFYFESRMHLSSQAEDLTRSE